jgi:hypothetical protein
VTDAAFDRMLENGDQEKSAEADQRGLPAEASARDRDEPSSGVSAHVQTPGALEEAEEKATTLESVSRDFLRFAPFHFVAWPTLAVIVWFALYFAGC